MKMTVANQQQQQHWQLNKLHHHVGCRRSLEAGIVNWIKVPHRVTRRYLEMGRRCGWFFFFAYPGRGTATVNQKCVECYDLKLVSSACFTMMVQ